MPDFILFANTGYQFVQTEMEWPGGTDCWEYPVENTGWLLARSVGGKAWLCIDTTTGDTHLHRFAGSENHISGPAIEFSLPGVSETIRIEIRASSDGAGDPIDVAFVLDFGNCRTMGLLVENTEIAGKGLPARPFRLATHNFKASLAADAREMEEVFDSNVQFVKDELPRSEITVMIHQPAVYDTIKTRGLFGAKTQEIMVRPPQDVPVVLDPKLFYDISPIRMGREAAYFRSTVDSSYGALTGMSSPKRYLWSDTALDGLFWHHITTEDTGAGYKPETVRGDYFGFVYDSDDRDWDQLPILDMENKPPVVPAKPAYARRSLMTMAIYELICQAYEQINSIDYRKSTDSPTRKRVLTDLVMSFPSNMSSAEVKRYFTQIDKAAKIFCATHGMRDETVGTLPPLRIRMETDEGTAGQLSYVYSEIKALGSAEQWLQVVGRKQPSGDFKARIACLDIGGGTTDLMIADYTDRAPGPFTNLLCEIKCLDGETRAGDDIVQRLLQAILIPHIANELSIGKSAIRKIFENTTDGAFGAQKERWVTEMWIPLARKYLSLAENDNENETFRIFDVCSDDRVIESIHSQLVSAAGVLVADLRDVTFRYNREAFRKVVNEVLGHTIWRMCNIVSSFDCDILVLSGRTTKLTAVKDAMYSFLPISRARIIPMDHFVAGSWYPMQDPSEPGQISDPKSVVVVGTAIEYLFSGQNGLGGMSIELVKRLEKQGAYYWGACVGGDGKKTFSNSTAIFSGDNPAKQIGTFVLVGPRAILGRRRTSDERMEMAPVYGIYVNQDFNAGPLTLTLRREIDCQTGEEELFLDSVSGFVGKFLNGQKIEEPAQVGVNISMKLRTLFDDKYFLDSGNIFTIDYDAISIP
jgi:hypothetical protein